MRAMKLYLERERISTKEEQQKLFEEEEEREMQFQ